MKHAVIVTDDTVTRQALEDALLPTGAILILSDHEAGAPPPPPPPPPPSTGTQLLSLSFDTLTDDSPSARPVTMHGDAVLEAGELKLFGAGGSANANGYVEVPDSDDWAFGDGEEFTIHAWINPPSHAGVSASMDIIGHNQNTSARSWFLRINDSGTLGFDAYAPDLTNVIELISTEKFSIDWPVGVPIHVAVTRDSAGVCRLFHQGIEVATDTYTGPLFNLAGRPLRIGANSGYPVQGGFFTGYINEVEVVVGEAKWTSNFTPPTSGI